MEIYQIKNQDKALCFQDKLCHWRGEFLAGEVVGDKTDSAVFRLCRHLSYSCGVLLVQQRLHCGLLAAIIMPMRAENEHNRPPDRNFKQISFFQKN
ncbi:MAG: hypothetical protein E7649_03685 [Ruminococcaceae bacterium]|nr:hypothetical protein [Oscillospiraceae bacterium]